jgi:hypothetical protein
MRNNIGAVAPGVSALYLQLTLLYGHKKTPEEYLRGFLN